MKNLTVLMIAYMVLFFSCEHRNVKTAINPLNDSIIGIVKQQNIESQNSIDSLSLDKILKDALEIANLNISKEKFIKKYDVVQEKSTVSVEINFGYQFSRVKPHLIIRRNQSGNINIDIYSKYNNTFKKVISHEQWGLTYIKDTIKDINGDGLKDFIVDWYGSTGCCLKAFSDIYILRADKETFSNMFEFINPTFSPKERLIRGVCYGHPGETEMYKYKWRGEQIDTLEFVSFEKTAKGVKTGKIIISDRRPGKNNSNVLKILNSVPDEYIGIYGYEWFTENGY